MVEIVSGTPLHIYDQGQHGVINAYWRNNCRDMFRYVGTNLGELIFNLLLARSTNNPKVFGQETFRLYGVPSTQALSFFIEHS